MLTDAMLFHSNHTYRNIITVSHVICVFRVVFVSTYTCVYVWMFSMSRSSVWTSDALRVMRIRVAWLCFARVFVCGLCAVWIAHLFTYIIIFIFRISECAKHTLPTTHEPSQHTHSPPIAIWTLDTLDILRSSSSLTARISRRHHHQSFALQTHLAFASV